MTGDRWRAEVHFFNAAAAVCEEKDATFQPLVPPEPRTIFLSGHEAVATVNETPSDLPHCFHAAAWQSHVGSMSLFVHADFQCRGVDTLSLIALIATADILIGLR